jgi:hydrogenase expression/formation protein HypE
MKSFECPITGYKESDVVTMAHGSGGGAMQRLIRDLFAKEFPHLQKDTDAAILDFFHGRPVVTTDSFVVDPIKFPGGEIGSLSVYGTVNDLVMVGAIPLYLTVAFIIEEGFPIQELVDVVQNIARAAENCNVSIVTGDTKVVPRGKCDKIFITTTGFGQANLSAGKYELTPLRIRVGDKIIISGDVGRHGMAIMSERNMFTLEQPVESDSAPLNIVANRLNRNMNPHCMRDATRGGVAAVLNEIAESCGVHIRINEENIPVSDSVRGLCEILGMDPLHVANEGRFVLFVEPLDVDAALTILRQYEISKNAAIIGEVIGDHERGLVTATTLLGSEKIIQMPEGELLPRIC